MKLSYRFAIASVVILFSLTVFPAIPMPLDSGGVVSASDEQVSSSTNSVRPSNVTSAVEPAEPPVEGVRGISPATKDRNEQQHFVAIAKENASINTSELSIFAEVGTITTSRAEMILPSQNISAVQDLDWVKRVQKQRFGNVPNSYAATVQNISSIEAEKIHQNGINGDNVKIGFIGYGPYISNVPYEEQVVNTRNFKQDVSLPSQAEPEHDTAALEQVSEMAPQSDFYITAIRSQTDFGRAVEYLTNKNVDVILTEVTYNVAPGDGTGYVAQKVNQATSSGVTVVTPAGNGRAGHYEGNFYNPDAGTDSFHNFEGEDELNRIGGGGNEVNGEYRFTITWSDFDSNFQSNYDLYIYNERTEEYAASSHAIDYYPQTSAEIVSYETDGYEPISLVIYHRAGDSVDNVEIHGGNRYGYYPLEYNVPEGSIVPPATAQSAVSVGAYNTPNEQVAIYSNQGPIGSRSGITVTGYSHLSSEYYNDGFGGTSGAAPYVAGTAGLMNDKSSNLSPQNTKSTIRETADYLPQSSQRVGGGLVDATAAVRAVSTSQPSNFDIEIDSTNAPIRAGERLEVTATVENTGDKLATKDVELSLPVSNVASRIDSASLTLDGGESQTTTLSVSTSADDNGTPTIEVSTPDDSVTQGVIINEQSATVEITNVSFTPTEISGDPVSEHEITVKINNISADGSEDEFEVMFPEGVEVTGAEYNLREVYDVETNNRTLSFSVNPSGGGTINESYTLRNVSILTDSRYDS